MRRALRRAALTAVVLAAATPAPASAQLTQPMTDLFAFGQGDGQTVPRVPVATPPEPELRATPLAACGPGSRPQPGVDGRVPAGAARDGLWCNVEVVGHQGTSGGFKVHRYVDRAGRECAYYDTALLVPLNAFKLDASSLGVAVLDMSDPSSPRQTATLTEPPMLSPHESLALNQRRGLLAAVQGNPAMAPGIVSIYDLSADCRHPVLQSTAPVARLGHESGFSRDGRTFYATSAGTQSVTAVDVTDPRVPFAVWHGKVVAHGMSLSADGTRAYVADAVRQELLVLDTSEIQARDPAPQVREVSRLTWENASIPQNAIPFTRDGHPYALEFDEYDASPVGGDPHAVGAARIIDLADETRPRVIANLRLQVHQPAEHAQAEDDPGAKNPVQGYAAHYCDLPTRRDPRVVACSFIASGLRVFDIGDLARPRQIAYHVAPTRGVAETGYQPSAFAMSKPVIVPRRREVWYSDAATGFHAVQVAERAWPTRADGVERVCGARRSRTVRVRLPRGARARAVRATLGARRIRAVRRAGRTVRVRFAVRGRSGRLVRLRVRVVVRDGDVVRTTRRYRTCTATT